MTLGLDNPALLLGLAFAAAPVLLHLFARARPPVFDFPSLWFLRKVRRESTRASRPRDLLLLALRTLLAFAAAAAFLKPRLYGSRAGAASVRNVVVVLDATASMSSRSFTSACAQAAGLLEGLGPNDRANLVWLRSPPVAVFPAPGANHGHLRDLLRDARPSLETGDPEAALRLAAEQLAGAEGSREIAIVSDFQTTQWRAPPVAPKGIRLVLLPVTGPAPANHALAAVRSRPARPLAGESVTFAAEVRNHSEFAATLSVSLDAGDWVEKQEVRVEPWAATPVSFTHTFPKPGTFPATLRLAADDFPSDNQTSHLFHVRPRLVAGVLDGADPTAALWRRALSALDWLELVTLPPSDPAAALAACDLAVLPGWDGARPEPVRDWVRAGGLLVWPVGAGSAAASLHTLAPEAWAPEAPPLGWIAPAAELGLVISAPDDPMFKLFSGGGYGNPAGGALRGRWSLPAPRADSATTLMNYTDGNPALVRATSGAGAVVAWNLDLRPESGQWAGRLEFLPLVGELLTASRGSGGGAGASSALTTGRALAWRADREVKAADVRVTAPDGTALPVTRTTDGLGVVFHSTPARLPGLYLWNLGDEVVAREAVHFPSAESDLRASAPATLTSGGAEAADDAGQARARREGIPLWPLLAAVAALALIAESLVAWKGART